MSEPEPAASNDVNPHYLDHVMATGQSHTLAASEDIVTANGTKLLAKGARVDESMRERLLQHKLSRPLEDCMQVEGSDLLQRIESAGTALLDQHPLLQALCPPDASGNAAQALTRLPLSAPVRTLVTVYANREPDRLGHAVGVAMLAQALARLMLVGDVPRHQQLGLAGLLHDVGELYIDPAYLRSDTRLAAQQWRHIVTHPLVGHRVLLALDGAGPVVAQAVLQHHERLDGYGYPHGLWGVAFTMEGQILAAAEWLMAVVESKATPLRRAQMADRLVPGEFSPQLLDAVAQAARTAPAESLDLSDLPPLAQAAPRVVRLAGTLQRHSAARERISTLVAQAGPDLKRVLLAGQRRVNRIEAAFRSAGLDTPEPQALLAEMAALNDPAVYAEIMTLVGELEWRMNEVERGQRLRAGLLAPDDAAVVEALIARIRPGSDATG